MDPNSSANTDELTVRHISLDWNVDFNKKRIAGSATLHVEALKPTDHLVLDGRSLEVEEISTNGQSLKFKTEDIGVLGQKIIVQTGSLAAGDKREVLIKYSTGDHATALQFIEKELTADKKMPYLYSQCQAIHARSICPCMDTPAVKQTYDALVTVPEGLVCLLSALSTGKETLANHAGTRFTFNQPIKMPIYLLAIVVGAMEVRDISARCAVWAEPSMVESARWEFEDTEKMLQTAEDLMGEYVWKRYDLVVLPPTFPFGGMENPCLSFVTPTLIVGDRSLTNVIAHEIAHSWTGNLVTNANWEHFWLNEGFTVFVERKIMGRLYGEPTRQFENLTGWEDRMLPVINETFHPCHEYTKLIPSLKGVDPDDAFSTIPYEKGSALLLYIEQQLESNERFEQFLRQYIQRFAYQSITTKDWLDFLYEFASDKRQVLNAIDFEKWLNNPGVPPQKPKFDDLLVEDCRHLAVLWSAAEESDLAEISTEPFEKMTSTMKVKVLDCIETGRVLSHSRVELLEKKYALNSSHNAEVLFSWMLIALKAQWKPIIPHALKFAVSQGRMKYCKPIFRKLFAWEESRQLALEAFEKNKKFMHPITKQVISSVIQ